MFPKEDFYHLLETKLINATPFGNPEAYRPHLPKSTLAGSRVRVSPTGAAVIWWVSERGILSTSGNSPWNCGTIRKFRRIPSSITKSTLSESRRLNSPKGAEVN